PEIWHPSGFFSLYCCYLYYKRCPNKHLPGFESVVKAERIHLVCSVFPMRPGYVALVALGSRKAHERRRVSEAKYAGRTAGQPMVCMALFDSPCLCSHVYGLRPSKSNAILCFSAQRSCRNSEKPRDVRRTVHELRGWQSW